MKKIFIVASIFIIAVLGATASFAGSDDTVSDYSAALNGNVLTFGFTINNDNSEYAGSVETTLFTVVKSALVNGDLPSFSALNKRDIVYIDQKSVPFNTACSYSFVVADEFMDVPLRVFISSENAGKAYADVNDTTDAGVSIIGALKSYNPNNAAIIRLTQGDSLKYETTIAAETGSGIKTQPFGFTNVLPGEYTLVVIKNGQLKYIINKIIVGNQNIDLKNDSRIASGVISLVCGDVNGDGRVDSVDLSILTDNFGKTGAGISEPLTDLNGDGQTDSRDLSLLLDGFGKINIVIP